jgi:uncharacterized Tic20 family protein
MADQIEITDNQAPSNQVLSSQEPSNEDRMLAMFSHLSIFFGSLIVPLIFWIMYKDKSKFVSFHALQSLFFHIVYTVLMVGVVIVCAVIGMLAGLIQKSGGAPPTPDALQIIVILALGLFVFGYIFGSIGYAIYLAINSYKGGMKKYPIIGSIVYKKVYGNA